MCEDNDHIEMIVEEIQEKYSETTYSVREEHSYNKNYKLSNQGHIPELSTDTIKTENLFECKSCELDFTTAKQLGNHTFWCRKRNKPGVMFNVDLKEEVLEINNYENYKPVKIQQKKQNMEQVSIKIEDSLEKCEVKKEINEELIIKDELSDTHAEIDNYENYKSVKIQQKKQNIEQVSIKIENSLEKCEVKKEINEELIIKDEPSDIHDDVFECEMCELAFDTNIQLIDHTSWCRRNKRPIGTLNQMQKNCASISRSASMNKFTHSKKKLYPRKEPYECDVCKRSFRLESGLINHHKIYHTNDKPFACNICKRLFSYSSTLMRHMGICAGDKPYDCDICKKSFRLRSHLISHKLIHTGEGPFTCDVCKKSFRQKRTLNEHKNIHTGEKPFACEVCNKTYKYRSYLLVHKRIHNAKKPYKCDICKISFRFKSNLKKHECLHPGL